MFKSLFMSSFYKQGNPLLGSTMMPSLVFEAVREFIESTIRTINFWHVWILWKAYFSFTDRSIL